MSVSRSVAEVLAEHVTLEVEGIDRMYLNVYVPGLQREQGVVGFFRFHRGHQFVSSALMDPISKTFVGNCQDWRHGVESGPSAGILSGCMPPMTCPYCPSRPISKRIGTTDLGYGVFRCSACRRKFNERTGTPFNHLEFPTDIVFQVVLCRLRYKLSLRDLVL